MSEVCSTLTDRWERSTTNLIIQVVEGNFIAIEQFTKVLWVEAYAKVIPKTATKQ